jgi:hemin uptake protein HemP
MINQPRIALQGRESDLRFGISASSIRQISSLLLLGKAKCLFIEHDGFVYQLRITKLGKLVLTK